jgi:hypothetical protein
MKKISKEAIMATESDSVPKRAHKFTIRTIQAPGLWNDELRARLEKGVGCVNARNAYIAACKFAARIKRQWKAMCAAEPLERGNEQRIAITFVNGGKIVYAYDIVIRRKTESEALRSVRVGPGILRDKTVTIGDVTLSASWGKPVIDEQGRTQAVPETYIISDYTYHAKLRMALSTPTPEPVTAEPSSEPSEPETECCEG